MTLQSTNNFGSKPVRKPRRRFLRRAVVGGGLDDFGRFPRYAAFAILGSALIWAPITGYLKSAPLSYKSTTSLILPGSGASASLNLTGIGQASSYANSAFSSNAVSPTETYKRLLGADRILDAAAESLSIARSVLGQPRVELVDQTSLIKFEMTGRNPFDAQRRGEAILVAFFEELDALRADEQTTREDSSLKAIADYRASVAATRDVISALQNQSGLLSVDQYHALLDRHAILENEVSTKHATLSDKTAAVLGLETQLGLSAVNAAHTLKLFADGGYMSLMAQAATFSAALAKANSQYGSQHPKVQEAQKARDTANASAQKRAIMVTGLDSQTLAKLDLAPQGARADLLAQLIRMDTERIGQHQELNTLETQLDVGAQTLARTATAAAQLQDLERDFSVAEAVFASAIARAQSTKSDMFASYPLVQVLENPSLPEHPSSPNRKLAVAAGIAATLMLLFSLMLGWIRMVLIGRLLNAPKPE